MKSLLKIFTILTRRQMKLCAILIFAMFLGAVMEAAGIGLLYPLITIISTPDFLAKHAFLASIMAKIGVTRHSTFIIFCAGSLIFFFIFKNVFIFLETRFQIYFSVNNQRDYTKRLYAYYLSKPYLYHVNVNSATLLRNVTTGAQATFQMILIQMLAMITEVITSFIIWVTLLLMDWFLAIVLAFLFAPLIIMILKFFRSKITRQGAIQRKYYAEYVKWLNQGLGAIKETKVMQTENFFTANFDVAYSKYSNSNREYLVIDKIPRALIELVGIGGFLILVIAKVGMGADPASLVPTLGVLAFAAMRLMPSMNRIVMYFNSIKFNMPLFNEIYDDLMLIKHQKTIYEERGEITKRNALRFESEINIKDLSFKYPNTEKLVIDAASFSIPKGSFAGIIGPSGAGKTTFVDILLGLLPPTAGGIFIDGKDLFTNISGWLYHVSYVPQSIYLIDGSIKENIALGVKTEDMKDSQIEKVIKMAELHEFVDSLPEKENTNVGEMGVKLSGGQRQRIGIARALYKNPTVLVLDEATSALDNETEKSITKTILKLKGTMTIISIAHRLSTLEDCDFKIRFEGGKAVRE